jgi:hypothetical protein
MQKLELFINQELPILIEKGYLTEFCNVTENCNIQQKGSSVVRISQRGADKLLNHDGLMTKKKKKANPPSFDLGTCSSED